MHSSQYLKDMRVLLSILRRQSEKQLDVQTRIWPFSVQFLQERALEFEIVTTDTRTLSVKMAVPVTVLILGLVCWLRVYLMDRSAQTILLAATMR